MGGYELEPMPWTPQDGIPRDFHFQLLDSDWDQFEGLFLQAAGRVPSLENAGIRQLINGPEAFTPDGSFILGEAPELPGYLSAPVSTLTASRPTVGRGGRWRSGLSVANRRWTCGRWTSGVSALITAIRSFSSSARPRRPASITPWLGQARSTSRDDR